MRLSAIIVGLGLAVTALAAPQPVDTALEPSTKKAPLSLRCTVYRFMCIGKPAPPEDAAKVESGAANVPENCIVCESTISRVCGDVRDSQLYVLPLVPSRTNMLIDAYSTVQVQGLHEEQG